MARRRASGNLPFSGLWTPEIDAAAPDAVLPEPVDFELWCHVPIRPAETKCVEAVVSWSGATHAEGQPVTAFEIVPLARERTTSRSSATLPASALSGAGAHTVLYTAARDDGLSIDLAVPPTCPRDRGRLGRGHALGPLGLT